VRERERENGREKGEIWLFVDGGKTPPRKKEKEGNERDFPSS
jgi:hypothetical protein